MVGYLNWSGRDYIGCYLCSPSARLISKVVIIDVKEYSPETLLAIAAIVLALAGAYYLQKRSRNQRHSSPGKASLESSFPKVP